MLEKSYYQSSTGANFDFRLRVSPYRMKINGAGNIRHARPPKMLIAGPTPRLWNMGCATKGNAVARRLRRKVFAAVALAA